MLSLLQAVFGIVVAASAPLNPAMTIDQWNPSVNDRFIVDTQANVGYIVHEDGHYLAVDVLTGQRRTVNYLGKTYNATTPTQHWTVLSTDIKGDHVTFGPTGLFMRLYADGTDSTAYGIHGHSEYQEMEDSNNHFRSMGCIIVSERVLDILHKTYELNGNKLEVATVYGVTVPQNVASANDASWMGF